METFYEVKDGKVTNMIISGSLRNMDIDFMESVLCYCETAAEALNLAKQYDAGEIQPDNISHYGKTYVALRSVTFE